MFSLPTSADSANSDPPAAPAMDLAFDLGLSHGVPFRVTLHDGPPRLHVDLTAPVEIVGETPALRMTELDGGGVRLTTGLPGPMAVERASMALTADGIGARLALRLRRVAAEDFAAIATALPEAVPTPETTGPTRSFVVALDPGHGGSDSGAAHGAILEAHLVLTFARELKEDLLRTTDFDIVLTRNEDQFVTLQERINIARRAGADVFLSLHADGIENGSASGVTVFTHAERASNPTVAQLARAHRAKVVSGAGELNRDSLSLGLALDDTDRRDTAQRSENLAAALIGSMADSELPLYKHPRQQADFVVLRAPDMPSALVELGFLSEPEDRERLAHPGWRARMAAAIRRGLLRWSQNDAALAALRQR